MTSFAFLFPFMVGRFWSVVAGGHITKEGNRSTLAVAMSVDASGGRELSVGSLSYITHQHSLVFVWTTTNIGLWAK